MRLLLFLFLILFIQTSCNNSSGEVDLSNENEVHKALCNNWEAAYMETGGMRMKVPETQITRTEFLKDGTFRSQLINGAIITKGKWDYDPETNSLYHGEGDRKGSPKVLKLTGNELICATYRLFDDEIIDSVIMTYRKH